MKLDRRFEMPIKRPKRQEIMDEAFEDLEDCLKYVSKAEVRATYYHTRHLKPGRKS